MVRNIHQKHNDRNFCCELHDFEVLRTYLPQIFPSQIVVDYLNEKSFSNTNKDYNHENLKFHIYDEKWLVSYIMHIIDFFPIKNNNQKIKPNNIKSFIQIDPEFNAERERYEQSIIRNEINNLMDKCRNEKPYQESNTTKLISYNVNTDEVFRKIITTQLLKMGINAHSIEIGLEKNANLWRPQTMNWAYENEYVNPLYLIDKKQASLNDCDFDRIIHKLAVYKKMWVNLREYNYYKKHQATIDELNLATENMKDTSNEKLLESWQCQYENIIQPLLPYIIKNQEKFDITINIIKDR